MSCTCDSGSTSSKRSSRCPGRPTQSSCASPTSTNDDAQSQELEVLWEAELAARAIPNLAPAADRRSVQQPAARLPRRLPAELAADPRQSHQTTPANSSRYPVELKMTTPDATWRPGLSTARSRRPRRTTATPRAFRRCQRSLTRSASAGESRQGTNGCSAASWLAGSSRTSATSRAASLTPRRADRHRDLPRTPQSYTVRPTGPIALSA